MPESVETAGPHAPYTVVFILGSGHCGSTLLDLLLNAHSRVLGLGEIGRVGAFRFAKREHSRKNRELATPIWQRVVGCYEATSGQRFADIDIQHPRVRSLLTWSDERVRQWARPSALLFSCLARESGAQLLVDSSKRAQRLYLLRRSGCFSLKVIHLRRDGRAIIHSYRKRGSSFGAGFRRWLDPTLASVVLRRQVGASDWMGLRYEDLASAPEDSLRRVCAFLDLEFEPGMLDFRAQPSIAISGNRMRYGRDQDIVIDDAWRLDFGCADRVRFALLGSVINRLQGYGEPKS
jgi:hypothetical protein